MRWLYESLGRRNTGIAGSNPCREWSYVHYPVVVWIRLVCEGTIPEGLAGTAWEPSKLLNYVSVTPPSKR
jgi:hypothetical protein